jgi:hypothetical protein
MKQPETILANYFFLFFIGFLIFLFFSITMWILNLYGRCNGLNLKPKIEEKKKKKSTTIIYLLIFVLLCSMAAQAVNQSYQRIIPKTLDIKKL